MDMDMMMYMSFYNSNELVLLWKNLDSQGENGKYFGLLAIVVVWIFAMEFLSYKRHAIMHRINTENHGDISGGEKAVLVLNYGASVSLAYLVMLAVMSFNVGVFIVTILSLTMTHMVFGYFKHRYYTIPHK